MKNYLREQSAREVLESTAEIYRRHLGLLFLIHLLPTFAFNFWSHYIQVTQGEVFNLAYYVSLMVELLPFMAIAVAVSDICLGNKPSAFRSYSRVFGKRLPAVILTYILVMAGSLAGFLLFVAPGVLFYTWFMFSLIIVVLEGSSAPRAFGRSKKLGEGYYLRNLGLMSLLLMIALVLLIVVLVVYEAIALAVPALSKAVPSGVFQAAIMSLLMPFYYVGGVLLYYDMRVRKEAYDSAALTEDLMR